MAKRFSARTLGKFEDASAGIPLRQLNRAFDAVGIRLGQDPGGVAGSRKVQFRRYVASLDQADPQQLARLGAALGSLIDEVATSKQAFLVEAAERDGFSFGDGVFRPAATGRKSFAVERDGDAASIDERGRRLLVLANERPKAAVEGAQELVDSVKALASAPEAAALVAVVAKLGTLRTISSRHARLAVGTAVTFAHFVAETHAERAAPKKR